MAKSGFRFIPTHSNIAGVNVHRLTSRGASPENDIHVMTDMLTAIAYKRAWSVFQRAWSLTSDFISGVHRSGKMPFRDITGNLYESMGVALVGKNRKTGESYALASFPASKEGFKSQRKAFASKYGNNRPVVLKEGTTTPVGEVMEKTYKIPTDRIGSGFAKTEREQALTAIRQANPVGKSGMYNLVVFAAMPYASYVNMKRGREFMQSVMMSCLRDAFDVAKREASGGMFRL